MIGDEFFIFLLMYVFEYNLHLKVSFFFFNECHLFH